jgi:HEAT repeat protein
VAASPAIQLLTGELIKMLDDPYWDVRSSAALALGKMGQNSVTVREKLLATLRDKNTEVQESAALALGMIKAVETTNDLANIIREKRNDQRLRSFAAVALGLMENPANLPVLQTVLNSADTKDEVKAGTILGIGLLKDERGAHSLLSILLGNEDEELQAFAVAGLARIGKTDISTGSGRRAKTIDLIEMFEKKLVTKETQTQVRRAIALALGTIGKKETSIRALQQAYQMDRDKGVKGFALMGLAQMAAGLPKGDADKVAVRDFLRRAVQKENDVVVKGFAVLSVGLSRDEEAGELLLGIFKSKEDPDVRAAAAIGLGIVKHADAIPYLASEITKPNDGGDARGFSCVALGMIGDVSAAEYLMAVLKDVNVPYLTWAASTGLAILNHKPGIPLIQEKIEDRNKITRESAIRSLMYFRDDATISPLLDLFKKEKQDEIRAMIIVTLGVIGDSAQEIPALRKAGRNVNWVAAVKMPSIDLLTRLF